MAQSFQTPHNSPSDAPLIPEYQSSYQKHCQQQQQGDQDRGHVCTEGTPSHRGPRKQQAKDPSIPGHCMPAPTPATYVQAAVG